jgi:superfamily II DNA or RNA helicase
VARRGVNSDPSRIEAVWSILEEHPKVIIFYNYDYELEALKHAGFDKGTTMVAGWNGHKHQPIPQNDRWVYLVQYTAGAEGWNCVETDTIIFFSLNYSYKIMVQSAGRIDRMNTPFTDLYYYRLKSSCPLDIAISRALRQKKNFNENKFVLG